LCVIKLVLANIPETLVAAFHFIKCDRRVYYYEPRALGLITVHLSVW
jgi:hypothetical protein